MTVVPVPADATAEEASSACGGLLVDAGPFDSYEETYDALLGIRDEEEEREPRQP
ncbi:MAG: hypothetical protein R3E01_01990 [Pirellulaceae bacterium]